MDSNTDVVYQLAAEGPGGVVTARDFVNVRHWKKINNCLVCANISVIHKDEPPQKSIVRCVIRLHVTLLHMSFCIFDVLFPLVTHSRVGP